MKYAKELLFSGQMVVLGLAIAFVVVLISPPWLTRAPAPVEIRQTIAHPTPTEAEPQGTPLPATGPASYAAAVERAAPAVVNINTAKIVTFDAHPLAQDPFFRQFLGDQLGQPQQRRETSLGSGVIVSPQGYILTNAHVIRGADEIQVGLRDGRMTQAKVIGADPDTDLAVLKIGLGKLPVIRIGISDRMHIGDVVLAIGNPFGVGQTVTMGIISATGRSRLGINTFENFIQTDAAINPGNSGGALVDVAGNLIGINTAIFSRSGGYQGIGFAIPTSLAQGVMEEIIKHGRLRRGWLGAELHPLNDKLIEAFGLKPGTQGLVIAGLVRNGPAHRAGLLPGDILTSLDGKAVGDPQTALGLISAHQPGEKLRANYLREGRERQAEVTTAERPARAAQIE